MKTALITGIQGQDGAYLSKLMLDKGYRIVGTCRESTPLTRRSLRFLEIENKVEIIVHDGMNLKTVIRLLEEVQPDEIYNLAAQSSVAVSFKKPLETLSYNIMSVSHILEAIRTVNPKIRFYQASSSEMFGNVNSNILPIHENTVIHPVSPYAISKAAAHWLTVNYRETYDLHLSCGILFNHESALRGANFVTKKIINTAVHIALNHTGQLRLGNLEAKRDWGYAPAYTEAMWKILQKNKAEDYIICSKEAHSISEFAEKVFVTLGLELDKHLIIDPELYRPLDLEIIYGDNTKAKKALQWEYDMTFDSLIKKLVEDEIKFVEWLEKDRLQFHDNK